MEHKDLFEKNVKQLSQVSYFLEICVGFLSDSMGKEFACNAGDAGEVCLIPGLGTASGGGYGNPLQCSCLEKAHGQRSLVGYSSWGRKESSTNVFLSL